jgi:cell division protein FtsL
MLMSIFLVSLVIWLLGVVTESMFGGFIHLLLLVAVVTAGISIIQRRRLARVSRVEDSQP